MGKNSVLIIKKFDSEPSYGDNNKIKMFGDDISTNFQGNEIPKQNVSYDCF